MAEINAFQRTNTIVLDYLAKESFKLKDLENEISTAHLPMRVAPGETVRAYLTDLVEEKRLIQVSQGVYRAPTNDEVQKYLKNPLCKMPIIN